MLTVNYQKGNFWRKDEWFTFYSIWDPALSCKKKFSRKYNGEEVIVLHVRRDADGKPYSMLLEYSEFVDPAIVLKQFELETCVSIASTTYRNVILIDLKTKQVIDQSTFTSDIPVRGLSTLFIVDGSNTIGCTMNPNKAQRPSDALFPMLLLYSNLHNFMVVDEERITFESVALLQAVLFNLYDGARGAPDKFPMQESKFYSNFRLQGKIGTVEMANTFPGDTIKVNTLLQKGNA